MKKALWVTLLLTSLAFAGCTDSADTDAVSEGDDAMPLEPVDEGLTVDSIVDAPEWAIGDHFGHHIFFGATDTDGTHIDTVVVDQSGKDWILGTDTAQAAKWESVWDFPMLGTIGKDDLATTAFGSDWTLYDFPLQDGKSWTSTFDPLFNGPRDLTLTATFDPAIPTIGQGKKEGFRIEGVNANGDVELTTDYIPEIGWYSELTYVDRTANPEATDDDFVIRVWAMGQGENWEGTIVDATAEAVIQTGSCLAPPSPDNPPTNPFAGCNTVTLANQFQISEAADEMYGINLLWAVAAHVRADLVDPTGFDYDDSLTSSSLDDVQFLFEFIELEDPAPGAWHYSWKGAGFVMGGQINLWEIQYSENAFSA